MEKKKKLLCVLSAVITLAAVSTIAVGWGMFDSVGLLAGAILIIMFAMILYFPVLIVVACFFGFLYHATKRFQGWRYECRYRKNLVDLLSNRD